MKRTTLITTVTLMIVCGVHAVTALAADPSTTVDINIHPGSNPNIINTEANGVIPVMIFGSRAVDVRNIDPLSLKLEVNFFWCPSSVATVRDTNRKQTIPLCDIRDDGSPDGYSFDGIGPPDGHEDLICHFTKELGLVREGIQPVTLTGIYLDAGGNESPLFGSDFASGPAGTQAIVRCCSFCFEDGSCDGCNGEVKSCGFLLRVCDGDTICEQCTGCEPPATS